MGCTTYALQRDSLVEQSETEISFCLPASTVNTEDNFVDELIKRYERKLL